LLLTGVDPIRVDAPVNCCDRWMIVAESEMADMGSSRVMTI